MSELERPAWYQQLAAAPQGGAVLNLPVNWDRPQYLLYQTLHGRPLISGYTSRREPLAPVELYPGLQQLRALGDDILAMPDADAFAAVARDLGLSYVVVDAYQMPGADEAEATKRLLRALLGEVEPVYETERFAVYSAPAGGLTAGYVRLTGPWGPRELAGGVPFRRPCPRCGVLAVALEPVAVTVNCDVGGGVRAVLSPGVDTPISLLAPGCAVVREVTWSEASQ
jgi:hypothetical protein